MKECKFTSYIQDKGEFSLPLEVDLSRHLDSCEQCREIYLKKIIENKKLKDFFKDLYLTHSK